MIEGCKFLINITTLNNIQNEKGLEWYIRPSKNTSMGIKTGCPVHIGAVNCVVTYRPGAGPSTGGSLKDFDEFALYDSVSRVVYATASFSEVNGGSGTIPPYSGNMGTPIGGSGGSMYTDHIQTIYM